MELSALIKKIGHSLVEIRVRALKSVLSKLDHSLISIHDVVQEKMLFVYLLEWFNFPEVPMSNEVLDLLLTLSKHPSSAQMLRDVGAVDFLTQLSPNVKPRQRAVIDGTLDQLFMLPDLLPTPAVVLPEENSSETGFFHKNTSTNESVRCLKFSVFPWLTLTNTDRHILSSNESSLGSNNPNLVRTTCELLCDVIMQDFPAEIFLQRPNIAKKLLSLLKLSTGTGEGVAKYLHLAALSCLRQLCVELRKRLRFHQDPSFYSAKQDQFSQNSSFSCPQEVLGAQRSQSSSPGVEYSPRPSVVGRTGQRARGDGQDGDVASNSGSSQRLGAADRALTPADVATADLPDLGVENILELQFQQLTLAQFSVATVEHAIPILKTEGLHVFQRALELLSDALLLLCESVSELVWDDHSLVGTELREKLRACLELLGDILCSHQSHSADISHIHQRMTYIGTAVFTLKLLQSVLPPEKASEHLPESTALAIFHLCLDSSLGSLLPSMQETAAAYLEQVNPDNHDLYRRVTRAALWMESTCNFIKEIQAEGEKNWLELLELADQSIDGLPFHQHLPVIQHCLNMCSYLWKFDQPSPLLQTESQKLLLKLLSHPLLPVRMETYKCTLRLVKDCLGIHNVSRQTQEVCAGVHFLLHRKLLYEIITFGLQDASEKVNVPAKDILLFLLQGRLMMTPSTWDRFTQALDPVMAVLQGYASTDDSLGNCVLLISDTSAEAKDDGFPRLAKLRASLRLLFSMFIQKYITIPCVLLIFLLNHGQVESVEKLFSILQSDAVDLSLRRSAADQLAVVLQDTSMHLVLKNLGITDRVISFIEKSVNGDQSCDCLLEPSVCILRKLVYVDLALRHSLAQRDLLLLTLLRASMILKQNKANPSETAVLMTLLLFDEIARIELWSDQSNTFATLKPFSLPLVIIRRYNLPFQAATHHAVSPHCSVLPPSSDLQTLGPARQALQVAWNTAWFCGTEKLLEHLGCGNSDITEFHGDLKLSEAQVCSLKAVHLPTALQDCVQAIVRAAAHRSVAAVLSRLGLYLLIYRMVLPHTPTYSCKDVLQSLGWQAALTRFLQVRPACVEDEKLLVGIVAFLNAYFKHFYTELETDEEDGDLRWILELLLNQEGVSLLNLLLGVETQTSTQGLGEQEEQKNHISQRLQRELTGFFNTLLTCVTRTTDRMCLALGGPFKSQLAVRLLQSLRVSDAPRFYGLPSLERTLRGMVVLTAQPGWSSHCSDLEPSSLCSKYLSGLLEVISSFYVEWGENSLSFMGKGVTKNAIICLLHLSHEMMTNVISQWSLGNEAAAEETNTSHLGLAWLVPLWVDRDPEVRFASLGLGAALSSISSGCQALCASCQNISGGLWGTLLNILLDQQESSLVRTEAAFILQNLVVMPMPANAEEAKNSHWQHPCVHDEVSGVSLVGLPALQALLYHCHYFQHMLLSASSCYRSCFPLVSQPLTFISVCLDSETSLTLPTYAEPLTLSSSRLFSSLSTSSTVVSTDPSGPHTPKAPSPSTVTEEMPSSRLMAQGQSETDTSDSVTSQDSCQDKPLAIGPVVIATPHLLTAHCGLLSNLLAVLPDFTLTAIRHNQLLQALARDGSAAHPSVSAALWKRWRAFAGTLTLCLEEKLSDSRLHSAALKFISTVFTEETKRRNKEVPTSQSKPACSLSDVLIGPAATQLCDLLLQSFEKLTLQDPLKKLTAKALTTLMACSPTAQDFAATTGLIDSCVEQMKQIYSQLNLMSLRPSKASQRKKVNWKSPISVAATDAHLTLALYALWPWLLLHDPTMEAALELLCVYTAHCTTACSALCGSGPAVVSGSKSSSTSSLMQSVMKLTSGFTVDYTPIHNLAFCLLTNLVQSRDCRGLLQKNNFLQAFLSVPMPKAAAVKAQSVGGGGGSLSAWLKLLLSVSLSEDGQQSILKVTGALELLVDLAPHRRHALLTLHNLCFNTANKSHLIANGTLWNIRVCVCVEFIPLTQGYERVKAGTCTPHQCV
uniref:Rotatin N-terminal domain-containing protein n=1 Tax=Gouania willdenowi TaxID=441366 RepID=A0A8C5N7G8_GOUWI